MQTGIVKWFNDSKGYGFIVSKNHGCDLFVHFKSIKMEGFKTLKEGQIVNYNVIKSKKGMQAVEVVII